MSELWSSTIITFFNYILEVLHKKDFQEIASNKNALKVIDLYQKKSYTDNFAKLRFFDAPYFEVEKMIPKEGLILDLGCGEGLFSNYLAICSSRRKVIGLDIDKRRIKQANKNLKNTKFIAEDVTSAKILPADVIVMFHLLHHLNSYEEQDELIKRATSKLKKNGRLVIVEIKPEFSFKFLTVSFVDFFLVPWIFEKKFFSSIYFRKSEAWTDLLKKNNYKSKVTCVNEGTPFPHVIFDCTKV